MGLPNSDDVRVETIPVDLTLMDVLWLKRIFAEQGWTREDFDAIESRNERDRVFPKMVRTVFYAERVFEASQSLSAALTWLR